MPQFSVVIPLYQTERYIAEAIGSVLVQTYADFEVVVVDDGSKDRGPEIARGFSDPRVRVITQANRGLAGARNTGIRESTGRLVALLDADDRWHPEKLARHAALHEAKPDVGLSFSASRFIDDDGHDIGLIQRPSRPTYEAVDVFCRNPVGNGSAAVLRRETLADIAFHDANLDRTCWFDESFRQSEDIECWTRIAATTRWRLGYVDAALTDYRVNSTGLSANTERQLETWRRFRAKVEGYAPELAERYGDLAEAYQLRYLARRAVRAKAGRSALALIVEALRKAPAIAHEEPVRTATTLAAATLQCALPTAAYDRIEAALLPRAASGNGPVR
jgi:glycosyltransferase involved in cell wall biosynthesis